MADHLRDATKKARKGRTMADTEYISKEAALACFSDWIDRYGHDHTADEMVEYQRIEDLLPADVVEVVRCKDCKWCHSGYCERFDDLIPFGLNTIEWENWFCADGERRANNG